ncbi:MAG: 4Fe-4S binding protein [Patescibacteria group bacterium]
MPIKIDYQKCCFKDGKCVSCCGSSCSGCVEACPGGALSRGKLVEYAEDKCNNCGSCISACKYQAITFC